MGKRTNTILQSAFFALAKVMPQEDAIQYMKDAATKSYLKKGEDVVDMNHRRHRRGRHRVRARWTCRPRWADAEDDADGVGAFRPPGAGQAWSSEIMEPVGRMDGDSLPVVRLRGARRRPRSSRVPLPSRSAASPSSVPAWDRRERASSATSAPSCARTPPSARSLCTTDEAARRPGWHEARPRQGQGQRAAISSRMSRLPARLHGLRRRASGSARQRTRR